MENDSVHLAGGKTEADTSVMTDRELTELAAKAYANPHITPSFPEFSRWIGRNEDMGCDVFVNWSPLHDDGDALRLAVRLNLNVLDAAIVQSTDGRFYANESTGIDAYAATRRAIVRAAAEIAQSGINSVKPPAK